MIPSSKSIFKITILTIAALVGTHLPAFSQDKEDPHSTSSALVSEAWGALDRKDYAAARIAITRCQTLYGAKAEEMQKALAVLPSKDTATLQWALNDVGTCTFILGKVAEAEKKKDEALAAYKMVVEKYGYAQCWDNGGWYWQPSVAAKERIAALTLETE